MEGRMCQPAVAMDVCITALTRFTFRKGPCVHGFSGCASLPCWPILTVTFKWSKIGYQLAWSLHTQDASAALAPYLAVQSRRVTLVMSGASLLSSKH